MYINIIVSYKHETIRYEHEIIIYEHRIQISHKHEHDKTNN